MITIVPVNYPDGYDGSNIENIAVFINSHPYFSRELLKNYIRSAMYLGQWYNDIQM